jgi:hypothetical protein
MILTAINKDARAQPFLSMSDILLSDEFEALQSIFIEQIATDLDNRRLIYTRNGHRLQVDVPTSYPQEIPRFGLISDELKKELEAKASSLIGSEMLYDLIELFQVSSRRSAQVTATDHESLEVAIEERTFHNETPFSVDKFGQWRLQRYASILGSFRREQKETGKEYFQRVKAIGLCVNDDESQ